MLALARPQVVHVLTPPLSHRRLVAEALQSGCHVLCEKPITPDTAALRELLALAATKDRILMETHNLLFNDQLVAIDRLIRDGRLGTVVNVDVLLSIDIAHSKFADPNVPSPVADLPGGAIHDFLPHMAYLVLHFFGYPEVVDVRGSWRNVSGAPQIVFDEMEALITLPDGTATVRFSSRIQPDRFRLSVRGTEGSVETDLYHPYVRLETFRGRKQLSPLLNHAANGLSLVASSVVNLRDKVFQHTPYPWDASHARRALRRRSPRHDAPHQWVGDGAHEPPDRRVDARGGQLMKLFVTGAGGFVGRAVVDEARSRGHDVAAMVRSPKGGPQAAGVSTVVGDLRHDGPWVAALAACDAVIHLAALDRRLLRPDGLHGARYRAPADGDARQRGEAARPHQHLLGLRLPRDLDEGVAGRDVALELRPEDRDDYTQTKLVQEQLVRNFAASIGEVVIIRPGAIYGPGKLWDAGLTMRLFGTTWAAIAPNGCQKLTYVGNCARAIVLAAEVDGAIGQILNIVDDDLPTQREYAAAVARHGFDVPRALPIPYRLAAFGAAAIDKVNRRFFGGRARLPAFVVPAKLDSRFKPFQYSNDRAKRVLGWQPSTTLDEALDTIASSERAAGATRGEAMPRAARGE